MPMSRRGAAAVQMPGKQKRTGVVSGRAAAPLRWIVVARGVVEPERRSDETRDRSHAVAKADMSLFGVMHPCGISGSTQREQKTKGQNKTHRICSNRSRPVAKWGQGRGAAICDGFDLAQISGIRQNCKTARQTNHCWQAGSGEAAGLCRGSFAEVVTALITVRSMRTGRRSSDSGCRSRFIDACG